MKPEIHPEYQTVKATCSCGNIIEVGSTLGEDLHLDVCSNCHPFYTGKQKTIDSGGRVERFRKRFGSRGKSAASAEAAASEEASDSKEAAGTEDTAASE